MGIINFLRKLASQLGELVGRNDENMDNSEAENPREYLEFLQELLQAEAESSDGAVIYPMLVQRQYLLNARFAEILQQVAKNSIAEHPETIESILYNIENLSIHIYQFRLGSRANNIEIAIAGYQIVLSNRQPGSEDWARTQNNLANAYTNRIRGEKAENIESAIAYYNAALTVRTRDAFPEKWADTQNKLGIAYYYRIRGKRAENIEQAIAYYNAALTVRTREAFREQWADTQNDLAIAYSDRIKGERAENIEQAIKCYNAALTVRTREAFREQWAQTQNNLGTAYPERIKGGRAENIESAIKCYTAALTVRTRNAFPQDWADTQNNLGTAYRNRIRGKRAKNIEKAIECYTATLTVCTREAFPEYWADTQNNLAIAYYYRIRGKRADNIEKAIECYTATLTVCTREAFPEQWARTQNNLANSYSDRIRGEKAKNIESAIKCYRQALEIWTPSAFPLNCLIAGRNLGNLAFDRQDWNNAIYGYENAISAVEQSREWATSQRSKREILQNALPVYEKADLEVEAISCGFNPDTHVLKRSQATKITFNSPETLAKLKLAYYAHFSCHGSFNFSYPLNSALILAEKTATPSPSPEATPDSEKRYVTIRDGRRFDTTIQGLTLREIFANLDLPVCRLLTLSACETGLVDTASTDEYIGLASGFLYAGATNVVSSLWSVSNLSTAFLMIRFYQELKDEDLSVCQALQAAQNWLRNLSRENFLKELDALKLDAERRKGIDRWLRLNGNESFPFANPVYWAAFCAIGL